MAPSPFEHGLALAWSDGALSRDGAVMLETLQSQLSLSDSERALIEESWLKDISRTERRSFGASLKPSGRIKTEPTLRVAFEPVPESCLTEVS